MVGVSGKKFPGIRKTPAQHHPKNAISLHSRRPSTSQHLPSLQRPRHIIHLLPSRQPNRSRRLQNSHRRPTQRLGHYNLHPRLNPLPHRSVRHRTGPPRPHHQTRNATSNRPPGPGRSSGQTRRLRLRRAPQTLRPGLLGRTRQGTHAG